MKTFRRIILFCTLLVISNVIVGLGFILHSTINPRPINGLFRYPSLPYYRVSLKQLKEDAEFDPFLKTEEIKSYMDKAGHKAKYYVNILNQDFICVPHLFDETKVMPAFDGDKFKHGEFYKASVITAYYREIAKTYTKPGE